MGAGIIAAAGIVDFLERVDPEQIQALRTAHRNEGNMLSTQKMLGDQVKSGPTDLTASKRAALVDLINVSVGKLKEQSDNLIRFVRAKMALVNRTKMIGGIIATISGAFGAALVYWGVGQEGTALASAFVAMLGGLATLSADYFEKAPSGMRIASAEEYGRLVEIRANLEKVERRIARDEIITLTGQELEDTIRTLDDHADRIVKLSYS
jgi:hypothetical protein